MSDEADRAGELEERERTKALARFFDEIAEADPQVSIDGVVVCLDCEDPLPAARLRAKPDAVRCIECQERFETRQRG